MIVTDKIAYIATPETITIVLDGKHRTVQVRSKTHRNEVVTALEKFKKSPQTDFDRELLEIYLAPIRRAVLASDSRFELSPDGKVLYLTGSQVPIPSQLGNHIIDFLDNSLPVDALVKFWESCLKNPHYVAIQELFNFLEENKLPITDDGGFLGYKKLNFLRGEAHIDVPDEFEELIINENGQVVSLTGGIVIPSVAKKYKEFFDSPTLVDVYSGKIRQKVGEVVKIERLRLNEEARRQECGYGLHIGAFSYKFNGDIRVLCKVYPEDVIACNEGQAKLRACEYQIVSFVDEAREVKEIYVNLQGEEKEYADGEHDLPCEETSPFEVGETIVCIDDQDGLTDLNEYTVLDCTNEEVLIVDDNQNTYWYKTEYFATTEE